jgi:methylenetetrahydrofolate reductase (NADPH)
LRPTAKRPPPHRLARTCPGSADTGEFATRAIGRVHQECADCFHIDVACYPEYHPQATSPRRPRELQRKVDGANSAITQYFFNAGSYYHFVDDAAALGIQVPIVPGVMPIASFSKLARFSDACGAEIPRWIRKKLESFGDDSASIRAFGLDVVTDLCADLLAHGAPGLHFYTINQASLTTIIWQRLGLS